MLKSKRYLKLISITGFLLIVLVIGCFKVSGALWMIWDFQAQDFFYKEAVKRGHGPKSSSRIKYLAINNGTLTRIILTAGIWQKSIRFSLI
jgi:hypothetical protein